MRLLAPLLLAALFSAALAPLPCSAADEAAEEASNEPAAPATNREQITKLVEQLDAADAALLTAKAGGRGRWVAAGPRR